ncbi:hypothetical protein [Solirubrobacter deserti]|uniref:Uncharacterized protein n=1 Tax=Solirubrobacter deserti TaxID=2282478 RepID=A0ABT4RGJ1_9ACTN|nr:hypothetical protein [Solirubrobacter deserti]MDA0137630.1 hypothetical protein [Solirubrobacter deserti]
MTGRPVDLGFSIADAEEVELAHDGDDLTVSFTDWADRRRSVTFTDTVALRWQRADDVAPGEAYDGANEIADSPWLERHRQAGEATGEHRHLKLNFNAAGCLEVLCSAVARPQ